MQACPAFSCEYSFDELSIRLCDRWETGLLLYGRAELTSAGDDYEDEFYVSAMVVRVGGEFDPDHLVRVLRAARKA
ncbi:hypothetical protein PH552_33505 [Rhizobium sp. CNPSo 3968]|uniref:hypothetical protein n=1 Tax=Rhizobium sp. CNPSo 3968 TaxID=3021408 RepID=UPI00255131F6|nr:hypothetical protein [Rhizobium sp. CNPSo 3968]MDK4724263.1 hypothetical protein [Rhizobium sp. CNPSo 3968]